MVVARNMPNLSDEEQVMVGNEWAHYMEIEVREGLITSGIKSSVVETAVEISLLAYLRW